MRKKILSLLNIPISTYIEQLQEISQRLKYNPRSENYVQDTVNFINECKGQGIPINVIEYFIINFRANKGIMKIDEETDTFEMKKKKSKQEEIKTS